jgi:Uma2 family endonuclease
MSDPHTPEQRVDRVVPQPVLLLPQSYQPVVARLFAGLNEYVTRCRLGRVLNGVDVVLDRRADLVLTPDIAFVVEGRGAIVKDRIWGPPDMVLDVTSPLTHSGKLEARVAWFSGTGVREFWLVQPDRRELVILDLAHGGVRRRTLLGERAPMNSALLPEFNKTLGQMLRR